MDTNDYMKIFSKNLEKYIRLSGKTKKRSGGTYRCFT